jgi:hypothetical protein
LAAAEEIASPFDGLEFGYLILNFWYGRQLSQIETYASTQDYRRV